MNKAVLALFLSFMGTASFLMALSLIMPIPFFFRMPILIGVLLLGLFDLCAVVELWLDNRAEDKEAYERTIERLEQRITELEREREANKQT